MEFKKKDLIKSPLNYTGGKFKLLPQILPLFPEKISMFYDVFGGGGNVALNCGAEYVYYNDIISYIGHMFDGVKGVRTEENLNKVLKLVDEYDLSDKNEEGFKKLREDYNNGKNEWQYFYALITHSFNYQIRFNNSQEYNSSFGRDRSKFSKTLQSRFVKFSDRLNDMEIVFDNKDFRDVDYSDADCNDLVYFDPPYTINLGVYQDGKRGFSGWNKNDEEDLLKICDLLNKQGTNFAMSNVFESKGSVNKELIEWSKKYKVHYINNKYTNSSYQRKDRNGKDIEVLITNY